MPVPPDKPLGILGGTFDPVHLAHLRLAEEAREALGLGEVLWIPTGQPPHRGHPAADPHHRLRMVELATADNPHFSVDSSEVLTPQPSYSVITLERLRAIRGPTRSIVLLLGADAFAGLATWHRWRELFGLAHIAVATRPGAQLHSLPTEVAAEFRIRRATASALTAEAAGRIVCFDLTALDISASAIRAQLGGGRSARYLLPDCVLDYISRNRLYLSHGR